MKLDKEIMGLELMDWKEIEQSAQNEICQAKKTTAIAQILLGTAEIRIKQLGGKTNAELDQEARVTNAKHSANTTNTTL